MSNTKEHNYVWAMEWRLLYPVQGEPSTLYDIYSLQPQAGVSEQEFEKFITGEIFPAVGGITLRGGFIVRHYLLKQHGDVELSFGNIFGLFVRDESIQAKFESLASSAESQAFHLVGSWESGDQ